MKRLQKTAQHSLMVLFLAVGCFSMAHSVLADDLSGSLTFIDPYTSFERTETVGVDGCSSLVPFGSGSTTNRHVCIDTTDSSFYIYTSDPVDGSNFGSYLNYSGSSVIPPSDSASFALTSAMFAGLITMLTNILPLLIGVIVSIAAFRALLSIVLRAVNYKDPVDIYAHQVITENERLMSQGDSFTAGMEKEDLDYYNLLSSSEKKQYKADVLGDMEEEASRSQEISSRV